MIFSITHPPWRCRATVGHKGILPREQNVHKEVVRCVVFAMRGIFRDGTYFLREFWLEVLTVRRSFFAWYLLWTVPPEDGTWLRDSLFLQNARG